MTTLYLLTEDDFDSLIYEGCAERMTGLTFTPVCRRMRKGSGIGAVRASLRLVLQEAARMAEGSGVHLLLAMDNDRAPHAASPDALVGPTRAQLSQRDARQPDRYAALITALHERLGDDHSQWRIPVAIAVPVEMIETWLIIIARGCDATTLPRFANQASASARDFHGPNPPPQLKDLCRSVFEEHGFATKQDWALHLVTEKLDPVDLAQRSPSFALFKQWLDAWPGEA